MVRVMMSSGPHDGTLFESKYETTDNSAQLLDDLAEAGLAKRWINDQVMLSLRGSMADGTLLKTGYGKGDVVLGELLLDARMHAV